MRRKASLEDQGFERETKGKWMEDCIADVPVDECEQSEESGAEVERVERPRQR